MSVLRLWPASRRSSGGFRRSSGGFRRLAATPPVFTGGNTGGCMVCYKVLVRYAFIQHKAVLVSTHIKKQNAKAFLVRSGLPFGSGLKHRCFFRTKEEASSYVAYLHTVYQDRIVPNRPLPGGQLYLF
jgi:hypothetical protein